MIFRNDDVNPNTNIQELREMYAMIKARFPEAEIYSAVNIFGQTGGGQMPYREIKPVDIDFAEANVVIDFRDLARIEKVVSHGLWHLDHKHASRDLQEYSIRTSCALLETKTFVPPFWRWNDETEEICKDHGIKLWVKGDWINLDTDVGKRNHERYLFHSWRFTPQSFKEKLDTIPQ